MVPAWIVPEQYRELSPPAEVMLLADQRSAENLLAACRSLKVTEAKRYAPTTVTWCNIYAADACQILKAPLPHVFDLGDGKGPREMRANDIFNGLAKGAFPNWAAVGTIASKQAIMNLAKVGIPQVAVWFNPKGPGHIVHVVPTPEGKTGIYVTGAGRVCVNECPIEKVFPRLDEVRFYHWKGK